MYVNTLMREVLNNGRALLVEGDAFELQPWMYVFGNAPHEFNSECEIRTGGSLERMARNGAIVVE